MCGIRVCSVCGSTICLSEAQNSPFTVIGHYWKCPICSVWNYLPALNKLKTAPATSERLPLRKEHFSAIAPRKCSICGARYHLESTLLVHSKVDEHNIGVQENKHSGDSSTGTCTGCEKRKVDKNPECCVGQTSLFGDVFQGSSHMCRDETMNLEAEVEITEIDAVITNNDDSMKSMNEIKALAVCSGELENSKATSCESCGLKAMKPLVAIAANAHCDTPLQDLTARVKLNLDDACTQITDKVDDKHSGEQRRQNGNHGPRIKRTKCMVDRQKAISVTEMQQQLADTLDILRSKDLAPSNKYLMRYKQISGIEKLFANPTRPMFSNKLIQQYKDRLRTTLVGNEDISTCAESDLGS